MPRTTDTAVPPADVARARRSRLSWLVDVSCWLAICVFLLGSFRYRGTFDGKEVVLEMSDWGFALVPMLFALAWGGRAALRGTWTARFLGFTWRQVTRAGENHPWRLWSMLFLPWGVVQLRAVLARYWSFNADWDLAIYAQACSHNLYSSLRGGTMLLADHFEPVLGIFAPLCRVMDPSAALLTVQTAALFAGAAGFAQLCRQQRWSWPSALVGAFLYTSFSGMRTALFYDFHLVVLAFALTPWLFVSLTARRWGWAALIIVLYCGLKETTALTIAGIGIWLLIEDWHTAIRPRVAIGALLLTGGIALFLLIMMAAFPHFRGGTESEYFAAYYGHLGNDMGSVLRTFLFDPGKIVATLAQAAKARYLVLLFAPFLGAVWLRPHYLFMLAAALAVNLLTNNHFLFSLGFHYEAELYSLLFVSVALLSRDRLFLRRWRDLTLATSRFFPGLRGVSFRFAWMLTIMALFGGKSLAWYVSAYPISNQIADVRIKLAELSPQWENRRVAASQALIPHLANVRNLYMLDRWKDADWVIVAYPYGQSGWAISREQIENDYVAGLNANFDQIYSDPSMPTFRVWKRRNLSHRETWAERSR